VFFGVAVVAALWRLSDHAHEHEGVPLSLVVLLLPVGWVSLDLPRVCQFVSVLKSWQANKEYISTKWEYLFIHVSFFFTRT
jgi:hypothetical protein